MKTTIRWQLSIILFVLIYTLIHSAAEAAPKQQVSSPTSEEPVSLIDQLIELFKRNRLLDEQKFPSGGVVHYSDVEQIFGRFLSEDLVRLQAEKNIATALLSKLEQHRIELPHVFNEAAELLSANALEEALARAAAPPVTGEVMQLWPFQYYATEVDADFDGQPEWIMQVRLPTGGSTELLLVELGRNGGLVIVPSVFDETQPTFYSGSFPIPMQKKYDLTGDNIAEIQVGPTNDQTVLTWHDGELQFLIHLPHLHEGHNESLTFEDFDGDGIVEMRHVEDMWRVALDWGYCWYRTSQYDWEGNVEKITVLSGEQPPQDPACVAAPDVLFDSGLPLPSRESLEFAAEKITPEYWPDHPYWYTLVHIKLAAAQWFDGDYDAVQATMDTVWTNTAGLEFAAEMQHEWIWADGDFYGFCRNLNHNMHDFSWSYHDYIKFRQGRHAADMGIASGELICPSTTLATRYLQDVKTPAPLTVLAERQLTVWYSESVGLDDDPELEMMTIVDAGGLLWIIWDKVDGLWEAKQIVELRHGERFHHPALERIEFATDDYDNDGLTELLSVVTLRQQFAELQEAVEEDCVMPPRQISVLYMIHLDERRVASELAVSAELAETDSTFIELLVNQEPYEWWHSYSLNFPRFVLAGKKETLNNHFDTLVAQFDANESPDTIRDGLDELQRQLSAEMPNGDLALAQIQFLRAYSYEVEGNSAEAVRQFQTLKDEYPSSIWAYYSEFKVAIYR